jgi:dTDP-4-amino-4,6-dideoxygalactose transaminase
MGSIIPILYQQAIPVFVDIDPATENIDPKKIEEAITDRTRAIMVTHIFGKPADMDPIMELAGHYNLFVIEDAAQAHMATYKGKYVGTIGHIGCFSLQQSKHITTGDGGLVLSDEDKRFGRSLRICFDKGWPRDSPVRDHLFLAPNYHMTELQAAVGIAQIEKYQYVIDKRIEAALTLDKKLSDLSTVTPLRSLPECRQTYFHYSFRLRTAALSTDGEGIQKALEAEELPCEHGYPGKIPLYLYPMLKEKETFGTSGWPFRSNATKKDWEFAPGLCPEAERACSETIVLPWNEGLQKHHVSLIAGAIHKVMHAYSR